MWTTEQVLALSPDASSTKNGQKLANLAKWPRLEKSEQAIWGECQGSGKKPYRTQIDLSEPAFRCSCPSRKFPCKHSLGLFLLWAGQAESFAEAAPPNWVRDWLAKRGQTAERKQEKQVEQRKAAADPVAQAKRAEKRAAKVDAGIADLERWMEDMLRQGLAVLPNQSYGFWDQAAARLVDAQAPGLARRVRSLASIPHSGQGWPERMLQSLSQLYLLIQGYQRLESLPPELQAELRTQVGWPQSQDDLRFRLEQKDTSVVSLVEQWQVLGRVVTEEDNLKVQRVWLWGIEQRKPALILSFAHGNQPLDVSLVPGARFEGQLIFYPGAGIQRAFVETREEARPELPGDAIGFDQIAVAIAHCGEVLVQNPWQVQVPLTLHRVVPWCQGDEWVVQDEAGETLPLSSRFQQGWEVVAVSGGAPLTLFGEWDGSCFLPLSLWSATQFISLGDILLAWET